MAQVLLLNPRKRRKSSAKRRKAPSAKQRANWARFAAAARRRASGGARVSANPAKRRRRTSAKRRRNPISTYVRRAVRRRRNPISLGAGGLFNFRSYLTPLKDAVVMGAGAVAIDVGYAHVNKMLPAMLRRTPGTVGLGDAVKALLTVAFGRLLSRPTRGLSAKAAQGALVVQAYNIAASYLPASMPVAGLGYMTSGRVVPGAGLTNRNAVGMYVGGQTPLLSRSPSSGGMGMYVGGQTPLLSRARR
jgi:hypothetical protein